MDVLTYETSGYSLGHYLRDNSEEFYAQVEWKPFRGAIVYLNYLNARHCNEYKYTIGSIAVQYPVLKDKIWSNQSVTGGISYELFAGTFFKGSIIYSNITSVDADGHAADPLDGAVMLALRAAETVMGRDRHCRRYTRTMRNLKTGEE